MSQRPRELAGRGAGQIVWVLAWHHPEGRAWAASSWPHLQGFLTYWLPPDQPHQEPGTVLT